ncbi:alpha/beta hydrolase [Sporosarcina aquimarina]|uniref:alpha/beta hydrolase n=1 Tax=Sporosarcina aquimarina TaxID=114975 RepID=UPI00203B7A6D|nr:alpha/beta fold hydrolase [Sporosarcina aquimarina]MCM3757133.1 alpha/beta hydrolase [Sporosarcina aquimarina]
MKKIVSKNFVNHVYNQGQSSRDKTIIVFHGWGSSVNNYVELAQYFSSIGFKVIVPEIIFHDSRHKLENHFLKEVTQEYFWKTIFRSIDDATLLFQELGVSEKDVILMGISMGGFIANGIYAKGNNFAGLININGSGSFLLSENIFRANDQRPELSDEEIDKINIYNPIGKNISNSSILLMHGELDGVISIDGQKDYFEFLKSSETSCDVVFNVYENVNHSLTEEMLENLKQWLDEKY